MSSTINKKIPTPPPPSTSSSVKSSKKTSFLIGDQSSSKPSKNSNNNKDESKQQQQQQSKQNGNNNNKNNNDNNSNRTENEKLFMNVTNWQKAATYERAETLSSLMNALVFSRLFSKDVFDVTVIDETFVVSGATHLTAAGVTEELQRQALYGNVSVKATLVDPEKVKLAGSRQIGVCLDGFVSHKRRLLFEQVLQTIEEKFLKDVICKVRYSLREGDDLPHDAMLFPLFKDLIDIKVKRLWNRAAWGVRSGLVHQIGEVRKGVRQKAASNAARAMALTGNTNINNNTNNNNNQNDDTSGNGASSSSPSSSTRKQNLLLASGSLGQSLRFQQMSNQPLDGSLSFSLSSPPLSSHPTLATNAASLAAVANEEASSSTTPSSRRKRPFSSTNEYYVAVTQDGLPISRIWLGAFPTLLVFWASWDEESVQFLRNWYSAWSQGEHFFNFHHHQFATAQTPATTTTSAPSSSSVNHYQQKSKKDKSSPSSTSPQQQQQQQQQTNTQQQQQQQTSSEQEHQQHMQVLLQQDPWFMWASRFLDPSDFDFHTVRNPAPPLGSDDTTITKHIRTVLQRAALLIGELQHQQQQQMFQHQKEMLETDVGRNYRTRRGSNASGGDTGGGYPQQQQNVNSTTTASSSSFTKPLGSTQMFSTAGIRSLCQVVFINCDLDKTKAMDTVSDLEREFFTSHGATSRNNNQQQRNSPFSGTSNKNNRNTRDRRRSTSPSAGSSKRRQSSVSPHNMNTNKNNPSSSSSSSAPQHQISHTQLKKSFNNSFVRTSHYWLGPDSVQSVLCETLDIRSFPTLVSATNKGEVHFVSEFAGYHTHHQFHHNQSSSSNIIMHNVHDKLIRNSTLPLTKPNTFGGDDVILGSQLDRHVFLIARDLALRKQRRRLLRQQQLMQQHMREKGLAPVPSSSDNLNSALSQTRADFANNTASMLTAQHADVFGATIIQGGANDFGASLVFGATFTAGGPRMNYPDEMTSNGGGFLDGSFSAMGSMPNALLLSKEAEEVIRQRGETAAAVRQAVSMLGKRVTSFTGSSSVVVDEIIDNNNSGALNVASTSFRTTTTATTSKPKRQPLPWHQLDEDIKESIILHLRQHLDVIDTPITFEAKRICCFDEISSSTKNLLKQATAAAATGGFLQQNHPSFSDDDNRTFRFLDRCMIRTKTEDRNGFVDWNQRIKALQRKLSSDKADPNDEMKIQVRIPDEFQKVSRQVSQFILRGLVTQIAYETKLKPILDLLFKSCCQRPKSIKRRMNTKGKNKTGEEREDDDDDDPYETGITYFEDEDETDMLMMFGGSDPDDFGNAGIGGGGGGNNSHFSSSNKHHFDINLDVVMCCEPWIVWHANLNNPLRNNNNNNKRNHNNTFSSSSVSVKSTTTNSIISAASRNEITCQICKRNVKFAEAAHFECLHCANYAAAPMRIPMKNGSHGDNITTTATSTQISGENENPDDDVDETLTGSNNNTRQPPTVLCFACSFSHDPSHVQAFFPAGNEYDEPIRTVWGRDNVNSLPQKRSLLFSGSSSTLNSTTPFSDMYYASIGKKYQQQQQKQKQAKERGAGMTSDEEDEDEETEDGDFSQTENHMKINNENNDHFQQKKNKKAKKSLLTMDPRFSTTGIHAGVFCDSCRVNIKGVRWKCAVCYDIDLCDVCFNEHVVDAPKWGTSDGASRMTTATTNANATSNQSKNAQNAINQNNKTATTAPPKLVSSEEPPNMALGGDSRDGRRRLCHFSHVFLRIATPAAGGSDETFILPEIRKVTKDGLRKL